MHQGVDFAGPIGTPIYAALDGVVVDAGPAAGFGNWIVIDSRVAGQPVSTVYGHMRAQSILVHPGQQVTAGQHIADIGDAGQVTGPHLHFEYWDGGRLQPGGHAIDPMTKLGTNPTDAAAPATTGPEVRLAADSQPGDCAPGFGVPGAGNLRSGSVPADLDPWIRKAGSLCPQIGPALIAAQINAESGFRRGLTSTTGAQGLTQFEPGTAAAIDPDDGKPYLIDADGNGTASIWDDGDAIIAQGRYMCSIAHTVAGWISQGRVHGDTTALTIAAYNAGQGAVLAAGGMPSGGDYDTQTRPYVAAILTSTATYQSLSGTGEFVPTGSVDGNQIVQAAKQYLGTPYVWGGGSIAGPTNGGFDCSGLALYAVYAASNGQITLPRTSEQQWTIGKEVPLDQAEPGDLLFGSWEAGGPGHEGIYESPGRMVHAPTQGQSVTEAPIQPDMRARRLL